MSNAPTSHRLPPPFRAVWLLAAIVATSLVTGCPTLAPTPSQPESVEPASIEPEAVEPESVEPGSVEPGVMEPESVEPGAVEPESIPVEPEGPPPGSSACAIDASATTSLSNPDSFEIAQSGLMERGPGGLTRTNGPYGNAIQNVANGTRWGTSGFSPSAMTRDWTKEYVRTENGAVLRNTSDDEVLWSQDPPLNPGAEASVQLTSTALSADDSTAAALWCWSDWSQDPVAEGALLVVTDVDTGSELASFELDACADSWTGLVQIHLNASGTSGVVVGVPTAGVTPFSVGNGLSAPTTLVDITTIPEEDRFYPARPILSAALSPNGDWLGASTIDGRVQMIEIATGDTKWSAPAGRMSVNQMTFQPSVESPVAFSTDGSTFVFTNEMPPLPTSGEPPPFATFATLSVATATTGEIIGERTIPVELFSASSSGVVAGAPMALLYDEQGLTVDLEGGSVHFGCTDLDPPVGPGAFEVSFDAPSTVSIAAPTVSLNITTSTPGVSIRGIAPTTSGYANATFGEELVVSVYIDGESEITITVLVDNGFDVVAEDVTFTVVD